MEIEKRWFDLNQTRAKFQRHAKSRAEHFVDYLSRHLSLPGSGQTERGYGNQSARLLLQDVTVQNDAGAKVAS